MKLNLKLIWLGAAMGSLISLFTFRSHGYYVFYTFFFCLGVASIIHTIEKYKTK